MKRHIGKFIRNQRGATAIEYGLIVALVVIVTVGGIASLGGTNGGVWTNVSVKAAAVLPS